MESKRKNIYKQILEENGIPHEVESFSEEFREDVRGMSSTPIYVTVNFTDKSIKPLYWFAKQQTEDEATAQVQKSMKLFEKEGRFLREYAPAVKNFCEEKGHPDLITFYPKCYFGNDEIIICENLVSGRGYCLLPIQDGQGAEAAKISLTTLAKHHAAAYAFIKETGGPEEFFKRFPNLNYELFHHKVTRDMIEPLLKSGYSTQIKLLELSGVDGSQEAIGTIQEHLENPYDRLLKVLTASLEEEKMVTLNHGDYWNNNMLFHKNEKTGVLDGHMVLDYQVIRYHAPALDVANFMFTSMNGKVRRDHFIDLINLYLRVLNETLELLGHPVNMSDEDFFKSFQTKLPYAFWWALPWWANHDGYGFAEVSLHKWIQADPNKSIRVATELVDLMREYRGLMQM